MCLQNLGVYEFSYILDIKGVKLEIVLFCKAYSSVKHEFSFMCFFMFKMSGIRGL